MIRLILDRSKTIVKITEQAEKSVEPHVARRAEGMS